MHYTAMFTSLSLQRATHTVIMIYENVILIRSQLMALYKSILFTFPTDLDPMDIHFPEDMRTSNCMDGTSPTPLLQ